MKTLLALFFKAHVETYTRKDGTVVRAHDDRRKRHDTTVDMFSGKTGRDEAVEKKPPPGRVKTETLRDAYQRRIENDSDVERSFRKMFIALSDAKEEGGDVAGQSKAAREFLSSPAVSDSQRQKWSGMLDDLVGEKR